MKKTLLYLMLIAFLASACRKNITLMNENTKAPSSAPAEGIFASAQRDLSDLLASAAVEKNIFRLVMQQWAQTTYTDESRYDLKTRQIPDRFFQAIYRDVLINFAEAKRIIAVDAKKPAGVKANQTAIADIMQVYAWQMLVNTFGNVPYTEALNYANITPKYDDARTITLDLLARLNADIAILNTNSASGSYDSSDLLYGGNIASWIKFANTLKLKLGMLLADSDVAIAQTAVGEAVAAGVFTSNGDNARISYFTATPNTNPLWTDLVQSGRNDFVSSKTIVDMMNTLNDPRRPFYFNALGGIYVGGVNGYNNKFNACSGPSSVLADPRVACVLLDYSETEFLLAEAVGRGFSVPGTAASHYENGITASILYWGGTSTDATNYLAQTTVAYATASGNYKQKIGEQKYLALYNRGFDAWVDWRRLDYPILTPAVNATSVIPLRFNYPVKEQQVNGANRSQASAAIGGDLVDTKLFWDKF